MTIDFTALLALLSDRHFLRNERRDLLTVMHDFLTHCGSPTQVTPLLTAAFRRFTAEKGGQDVGGGLGGESSSVAEAFEGAVLAPLLDRLVDLLSLEPVDSSTTSRVVACSLAALFALSRGHPRTHAMLAGALSPPKSTTTATATPTANMAGGRGDPLEARPSQAPPSLMAQGGSLKRLGSLRTATPGNKQKT